MKLIVIGLTCLVMAAAGCSRARPREAAPPAAGRAAGGGGMDAQAGQGFAPSSDTSCAQHGAPPRCAGGPSQRGYVPLNTGDPRAPYRCDAIEATGCSDHLFATLSDCLAACEPDSPRALADCSVPGAATNQCRDQQPAEPAEFEAHTAFGMVKLPYVTLERIRGFTSGLTVSFWQTPEADPSALPLFTLSFDPSNSLIGAHETSGTLFFCARYLTLPLTVTISRDELTSDSGEHLEGTLDASGPDFELHGQFAISRVCRDTISD